MDRIWHTTREVCSHLDSLLQLTETQSGEIGKGYALKGSQRIMLGSNRTRQRQNQEHVSLAEEAAMKWTSSNHHLFVCITLFKICSAGGKVLLAELRYGDWLLAVRAGGGRTGWQDFQHLLQKNSTCVSLSPKLSTAEERQCPQMESRYCQEGMWVLGFNKVPKFTLPFFVF